MVLSKKLLSAFLIFSRSELKLNYSCFSDSVAFEMLVFIAMFRLKYLNYFITVYTMPTNKRTVNLQKKKLFESSKNCKKVDDLFKNKSSVTTNVSVEVEREKEIVNENEISNENLPYENLADENILDLSTRISEISINDFNDCVNTNINDALKHKLLSQDFTPDVGYEFPHQIETGRIRKFSLDYLKKYTRLIYSKQACGAFCRVCVLFCKSKKIN